MPLKTDKNTKRRFAQEKAEAEARERDQKAVAAFMEDYKAIVQKHGIDFEYYCKFSEQGIRAASRLVRVETVADGEDKQD